MNPSTTNPFEESYDPNSVEAVRHMFAQRCEYQLRNDPQVNEDGRGRELLYGALQCLSMREEHTEFALNSPLAPQPLTLKMPLDEEEEESRRFWPETLEKGGQTYETGAMLSEQEADLLMTGTWIARHLEMGGDCAPFFGVCEQQFGAAPSAKQVMGLLVGRKLPYVHMEDVPLAVAVEALGPAFAPVATAVHQAALERGRQAGLATQLDRTVAPGPELPGQVRGLSRDEPPK